MVRTVVTRDPEWDDTERANMLALTVYEGTLCACGFPPEVADTDPDLQVKYRHCPVCAGLAKVARMQQAEDENILKDLGEKPAPDVDRPGDGRRLVGLEPRSDAPLAPGIDREPLP